MKSKLLGFFQELGKTFMLPVSLMAFLGIFLGISASFTSPATIEIMPFLDNEYIQLFFSYIGAVSGFAFSYLPVLFAIAIPLGLAKREKGVAAFSGFVGYMIMLIAINFYLTETGNLASADDLSAAGQSITLGIQSVELGVLGGIFSGVIVSIIHQKNYRRTLPDAFSFFSGARFVPIATVLVFSILGLIVPIIWIPISYAINQFGQLIMGSGPFGPFLFGAGERLLIPFGLHHILVSLIRFTPAGGEAVVNGETISGVLNIFYAKLNAGIPITYADYGQYTAFLSQGKMPTFMFGLPGAALAMYHAAPEANRKQIKGLLISGALTTFVVGITEPIEFLFLFVSPVLYLIHVVLTGLGFVVMNLLHVVIGNTDGGVIDWLVFGVLQGSATRWYLVPIVGIVWFLLYYNIFKWYIIKHDVKTPGRETMGDVDIDKAEYKATNKDFDIALILENMGGAENIVTLDNCITRLRMEVKDTSKFDEVKLKELGALGVVILDAEHAQVIIGPKVHAVKADLEDLLDKLDQ